MREASGGVGTMSEGHKRKAQAGALKRLAAAMLTACALAACQHATDLDKNQAAARTEPKKHRVTAKPVAPRVALRGTQGEEVAPVETADPAPARAGTLRATALDQLNRGEVDGAVAHRKAARDLDPANELILRDLERANRIRATVSAQPK